jgi:phenylpyruvate tautomerase PptA (4-oxalocrotonate tautomerase family)
MRAGALGPACLKRDVIQMPTYVVRAPLGLLSDGSKNELAAAITRIHAAVSGDKEVFVQVIFRGIASNDCYVGGKPLSSAHCFIQGHIREGWSAVVRAELISGILPAVCTILGVPRYAVWVYLSELPARAMSEFGHILPKPGDEDSWLANLPDEDRRRLLSL